MRAQKALARDPDQQLKDDVLQEPASELSPRDQLGSRALQAQETHSPWLTTTEGKWKTPAEMRLEIQVRDKFWRLWCWVEKGGGLCFESVFIKENTVFCFFNPIAA